MTITWEQYLAGELETGEYCKVCGKAVKRKRSDGMCPKCGSEHRRELRETRALLAREKESYLDRTERGLW